MSGDLDLNPRNGCYRLQANVPGVEIGALRATLGVRPIPFPVAGALRGVLHCTGPLEKPIFSGAFECWSAIAPYTTATCVVASALWCQCAPAALSSSLIPQAV